MDLTIRTAALSTELGLLEKVTPRKPTVPALAGALVTCQSDGTMTLVATDARVGVRSVLRDVKVTQPGVALLPVLTLAELLRTLPDGDLRMHLNGPALTLSAAGWCGTLQVGTAEDYPATPVAPAMEWRGVASGLLSGLVKRTRYAVCREESRGPISGALVEMADGQLRVVATDGHRLSVASAPAQATGEMSGILSSRTLEALAPMLDGGDEHVSVGSNERHAFVVVGTRLVFAQLLEGTFPGWKKLIPSEALYTLDLPRVPLIGALRRARMLADAARVVFAFNTDGLRVSSGTSAGSGDETLAIPFAGEPFSVGLNAGYVLDFLEAVGPEAVRFETRDGRSPVVLRASDGDISSTCVIMPIRL